MSSIYIQDMRRNLYSLISQNKLEAATSYLESRLQDVESREILALISSQLTEYKTNLLKGILSEEQEQIQINKIRIKLLQLSEHSNDLTTSNFLPLKYRLPIIWIFGIAILMIIVGSVLSSSLKRSTLSVRPLSASLFLQNIKVSTHRANSPIGLGNHVTINYVYGPNPFLPDTCKLINL